jgi:phospho-N-acetylmuramoyl-pentapeptide-transferase
MGALFGFLFFNLNPAEVFMGDTGSQLLGGILVGLAFITNTEILFVLIGGVLFLEALCVALQLLSLKIRNKRIFTMAPIHHTFELRGWPETKIVRMFWFVNFALSCLSIILYR